jgi:hypothetical protein
MNQFSQAARRWSLLCALGVAISIVAVLAALGFDARQLLVQLVSGVGLAVLLTDAFFMFLQGIPFAQPRMPGKTSFPLMLTLYVGVLPVFLFEMARLEIWLERSFVKLGLIACAVAVAHTVLLRLSRGPTQSEEEMEGYEGEFQLLNLAER